MRQVKCDIESWLGDYKVSGADSYKTNFCISL